MNLYAEHVEHNHSFKADRGLYNAAAVATCPDKRKISPILIRAKKVCQGPAAGLTGSVFILIVTTQIRLTDV